MKRFRLALIALLSLCCADAVAQQTSGVIRFEVPVLPEAARHLELLTVPSYLALALENNGMNPSLSSRLVIRNRESFQVKAGILRYTGRKGSVFNYEAGIHLSFGVGESSFTARVEVDTSALDKGTVAVRVFPPLARLIPQDFIERVEFKMRVLANLQAQRDMLTYFDRIAKEQRDRKRGFDGMLEAIAIEAYNRSGGPALAATGRDRGEAESLSDQAMLLATLAIWLIGFPVFLYIVRTRRKGQRPA